MNIIQLLQDFFTGLGMESLAQAPPLGLALVAIIIIFIVYRLVIKIIEATFRMGCTILLVATVLWVLYSAVMSSAG